MSETTRSRFLKVFAGEMPEDRLPIMEWATWWGETIDRWKADGLPSEFDGDAIKHHFGIDIDHQFWEPLWPPASEVPDRPLVVTADDYEHIREKLKVNIYDDLRKSQQLAAKNQAAGDSVVWMTLQGFFWWPRTMFGIEAHLLAFYDHPEVMHRMNDDLVTMNLEYIDELCKDVTPDFMTFAEDMSYNHGPMLSKGLFDEFLAPYYHRIIPELKKRGIRVLIDSDGDVARLIPWLEEVGIEGLLPLERRAGNDVAAIRERHPNFIMIGGYDKTVMHLGEDAMRAEFERLLPVMRAVRFIPSVDHQTPPDVSIPNYVTFVRLLDEYCRKAVTG